MNPVQFDRRRRGVGPLGHYFDVRWLCGCGRSAWTRTTKRAWLELKALVLPKEPA